MKKSEKYMRNFLILNHCLLIVEISLSNITDIIVFPHINTEILVFNRIDQRNNNLIFYR